MPAVATEGRFRFVVNTRENAFDPSHVHVWVGNEDACRIELNSGTYMDEPPSGAWRDVLKAYDRHIAAIRHEWDRIHQR